MYVDCGMPGCSPKRTTFEPSWAMLNVARSAGSVRSCGAVWSAPVGSLIMLVRGDVAEPQLRKAGDHDDREHANECPMGALDGDRSVCCATGIVAEGHLGRRTSGD